MVEWRRTKEILKGRDNVKILREYSGPVTEFIELETKGKRIQLTHIRPPLGGQIPHGLDENLYHVAVRK